MPVSDVAARYAAHGPRVVAMGGDGFSIEPDNPPLERTSVPRSRAGRELIRPDAERSAAPTDTNRAKCLARCGSIDTATSTS